MVWVPIKRNKFLTSMSAFYENPEVLYIWNILTWLHWTVPAFFCLLNQSNNFFFQLLHCYSSALVFLLPGKSRSSLNSFLISWIRQFVSSTRILLASDGKTPELTSYCLSSCPEQGEREAEEERHGFCNVGYQAAPWQKVKLGSRASEDE